MVEILLLIGFKEGEQVRQIVVVKQTIEIFPPLHDATLQSVLVDEQVRDDSIETIEMCGLLRHFAADLLVLSEQVAQLRAQKIQVTFARFQFL